MSTTVKAAEARMAAPVRIEEWPTIAAYREEPEALPIETLPIRTDIEGAIRLCVHQLTSLFDRDKDNEPFFYGNREADGTGKLHHSLHIGIPHVVGRCLLGAMAAESTGVEFPAGALDILERYLKGSFDTPDHINAYFDPAAPDQPRYEFHNVREGLFGLVTMIKLRDSAWAREKAQNLVRTLAAIMDESGNWSLDLAKERLADKQPTGLAAPNAGRVVEPLLALHHLTGDPEALRLAGLYAGAAAAATFNPDGTITPMDKSFGHIHTNTSTLSGMAEYAVLAGDAEMQDLCRRVLENGIPEYFSSWGWGDEVTPDHPANVVSRGEINQTGDVIRTALILAEAGDLQYYDLADRYLRSMLLPTQHTEADLRRIVRNVENPRDDSERNVLERVIGGSSMQLPNDRMREGDWPLATLDITSGATHALAACWNHRVTRSENRYRVNLLFDYSDEALRMTTTYPREGRVDFSIRRPLHLSVRVPEWLDTQTVRLYLDGAEREVRVSDGVLELGEFLRGSVATLLFDVPCRKEREVVDGTTYTTTWAGTQLIAVEPRGTESPLPF